ncbi:MAG: BamA/TamA family outer membrane protein, partial [Thermoanaerobaculia bacterium]
GNIPDIYLYDIASGAIKNVTNDKFFDGAPVFSPDGKWLIYSSVVNGYAKLFKLNLANFSERYQLTTGEWNDIDSWFSPDGKRIFFASDKQTGRNIEQAAQILQNAENKAKPEGATPPVDLTKYAAYNIYSLDLANGDVLQYTDVVGGCFTPVVFTGSNNRERMVYASYYKRHWRLYSTTTDKPLHAAEKTTLPSAPLLASSRTLFQPPVEVTIDPEKVEKASSRKLFVDDVEVNAGVTSENLIVSRSVIYMSDMLGDRRFIASLDSVSSFSNFDFLYLDLHNRTNWGFRVFDSRAFYSTLAQDSFTLDRHQIYRETGAVALLSHPFDRYHRVDTGVGYESRDVNYPFVDDAGDIFFVNRKDTFPFITANFGGDTTSFKEFGPISGHRYDIGTLFAPKVGSKEGFGSVSGNGAFLTNDYTLDARQYLPITSRSLLATRLFVGYSKGSFPNFYYFGGLNTLRGFDFRSIIGTQAAYANTELRFPLIDVLATPFIAFTG